MADELQNEAENTRSELVAWFVICLFFLTLHAMVFIYPEEALLKGVVQDPRGLAIEWWGVLVMLVLPPAGIFVFLWFIGVYLFCKYDTSIKPRKLVLITTAVTSLALGYFTFLGLYFYPLLSSHRLF